MFSKNKMQTSISLLLLIGTITSAIVVTVGGLWFLIENGEQLLNIKSLQADAYYVTIKQIWSVALSFTPLGIVLLGLLLLVLTQILRIALLTWFYYSDRDYWFFMMSIFILFVLVYSFIWRN